MSGIQKTTEARNETLKRIERLQKEINDGKGRPGDKKDLQDLKDSAAKDQEFIDKQMEYARKAFEFIERELHRQALEGLRGGGRSDGSAPRRDTFDPRKEYGYDPIHPDGHLDPRTLPIPEYLRDRINQPASGPNDGLAGPPPDIKGRYDSIEKLRRRDSRPEDGLAGPPPVIKGNYESIKKRDGKQSDVYKFPAPTTPLGGSQGYKGLGPTTPLGGTGYKPVGPTTPLGGTQGSQTIKTTVGAPVIRNGR
jgi:hypothetical protein